MKNIIKRVVGELSNIFQDEFNENLSQQSAYDRSHISATD